MDEAQIRALVAGALRSCIHDHGPITLELVGSATKRVLGPLRHSEEDTASRAVLLDDLHATAAEMEEMRQALTRKLTDARRELAQLRQERDGYRHDMDMAEMARDGWMARAEQAEAQLAIAREALEKLRKHLCSSCDMDDDKWRRVEGWNAAVDAMRVALSSPRRR